MSDIFISYASADRDFARRLADALAQRGYSVWWDRTIPPGRVFDEVIQEAIQGARCMIVLWSAESVRSNWVKTEASEGAARGMLVPALISEVAPPIEFKRIQSANLAQWDGDEAHGEYRNVLEAVERLLKQAPLAGDAAPRMTQAYRPAASARPAPLLQNFKTFALGVFITLAAVGGYWLFGKSGGEQAKPVAKVGAPAAEPVAASVKSASPPAPGAIAAAPKARTRVNLLSAEQGGQLLTASTEAWNQLIDGKEDVSIWVDAGFGVFGFRDGKTALVDTFAVLIPSQADANVKEFELLVSNTSASGPFESIGRFNTQNMRVMQNPYQEFTFAPVKARYFKFQSLRSHGGSSGAVIAYEIQLFGELQ